MMRALIVALLTVVVAVEVRAQNAPGFNDEQVSKMLTLVLDNISRARCGAAACAPATAEERAKPPISVVEARLIINRGILSAAGEHCGLNWQAANFQPMMAYWRQTMKKDERQLAMISMLHGIMQGIAKPQGQLDCTGERRANLERNLAFRP